MIVRVEDARVAGRGDGRFEGHAAHVFPQHEGGHVLEHGDLDGFAPPGPAAPVQREADGLRRDQAGDVIGHHQRHEARLAAGRLEGDAYARGRLDDGVVGRPSAIPAAPAEAQDQAVDQGRVHRPGRGPVQTELVQRAGPHVGDEDVRGFQQAVHHAAARRGLQVEAYGTLVPVEVHELPRHAAVAETAAELPHEVSLGRFDLDDFGAVVRERQ